MTRKSVPTSSRCVAKLWRSACGVTFLSRLAAEEALASALRATSAAMGRPTAREEPRRGRPSVLPVRAQDHQQAGAEHHQALLAALAAHVDHPARGVDVPGLDATGLADTQAGGVHGGEEHAEARLLQRVEQAMHLLLAQHHGQLLDVLRPGQERRLCGSPQRLAVQEPKSGEVLSQSLGAQALPHQVPNPLPNLRLVEVGRRAAMELRELCNRAKVVGAGRLRVAAQLEILHHLASKSAHSGLLGLRRLQHRRPRRLRSHCEPRRWWPESPGDQPMTGTPWRRQLHAPPQVTTPAAQAASSNTTLGGRCGGGVALALGRATCVNKALRPARRCRFRLLSHSDAMRFRRAPCSPSVSRCRGGNRRRPARAGVHAATRARGRGRITRRRQAPYPTQNTTSEDPRRRRCRLGGCRAVHACPHAGSEPGRSRVPRCRRRRLAAGPRRCPPRRPRPRRAPLAGGPDHSASSGRSNSVAGPSPCLRPAGARAPGLGHAQGTERCHRGTRGEAHAASVHHLHVLARTSGALVYRLSLIHISEPTRPY